MLITEDIIDNAVKQSINEFVVNEVFNTPGARKLRNAVGKVGRGLKNMVYNYMDKKTNGAWNDKYGKYTDYGAINAGTKLSWMQEYRLCQVLSRWIDYHRTKISSLLSSQERDLNMQMKNSNNNNNNVNKNGYYEDENKVITADEYAKALVNVQNFENFTRKYFSAFEMPKGSKFEKYINDLQKCAWSGNVGLLIRMLTYTYFYKYYGKNKQ